MTEDEPKIAPLLAEITGVMERADNTLVLELRVNIEGQDLPILLSLDALANHGIAGPAAAAPLQRIADASEKQANYLKQIHDAVAVFVRRQQS